jgi:hypothetical protein
MKAQSLNKIERGKKGCQPSLPTSIKFRAQVKLKEMKKGAPITIANSYENIHREKKKNKA